MVEKPDFERLKRERDAARAAVINDVADHLGVPAADILVHVSGAGCYCACPTGPCEHEFTGWREFEDDSGGELVCEHCGLGAMMHDMRCGE